MLCNNFKEPIVNFFKNILFAILIKEGYNNDSTSQNCLYRCWILGEKLDYLHEQISDVTVSLLSFPSGVKAHIFVLWLHPFKEQKLVVVGDRKMAVFDDVQQANKLVLYPHTITWKNNIPTPKRANEQLCHLS